MKNVYVMEWLENESGPGVDGETLLCGARLRGNQLDVMARSTWDTCSYPLPITDRYKAITFYSVAAALEAADRLSGSAEQLVISLPESIARVNGQRIKVKTIRVMDVETAQTG